MHAGGKTQFDIADAAAVNAAVDRVHPDWIINAAAFNDVDGAEQAPDQAFAVNAMGAGNLADAAARAGAAILHVSTDYVFDGSKGSPYTEDDRPNPLSVYALTKYEGEQRVLVYWAIFLIIAGAALLHREEASRQTPLPFLLLAAIPTALMIGLRWRIGGSDCTR